MKTSTAEKWLSLILLLGGFTMLSAIFPAFMPFSWMNATHEWIGLGELPMTPVVEYLTRTLSILYAITGGFSIMLSTNVKSYRPLIVYFAWIHLVMGILYIGVDYISNVPVWWLTSEGPVLILIGFLMLYYLKKSETASIHSKDDPKN